MAKVIGFVGAGQLGEAMVSRLLGAGHDVLVYARRPEVRESVTSQGATVADSVADLARQSDILISCLFSDAQLNEAGLGPDGFITNAKPGSIFVSHTTGTVATLTALQDSDPSPPVILDAPVSGTVDNIVAGTLTVLLGGPSDAVELVTPVLAAYADPIVPTGELGSALAIKLVNNLLFSCNAQLLAAAIQLGQALGVDRRRITLRAAGVQQRKPRGCTGPSRWRHRELHRASDAVSTQGHRRRIGGGRRGRRGPRSAGHGRGGGPFGPVTRLARNNIRVTATAPTPVVTTMIVENLAVFELIEKPVERRMIVR